MALIATPDKTIAVLGLGQAGGNIANLAAGMYRWPAAVMNTSQEDLKSALAVAAKFPIESDGGAGKDRSVGVGAVQNQYAQMADWVKRQLGSPEIKVLLVAFSLGGGTGSGVGPILCDVLSDPETQYNKIICAAVIIPEDAEDDVAKANTDAALAELAQVERLGAVFIVDNQKVRARIPGMSLKDLYEQANKAIIEPLAALLDCSRKTSLVSNFDRVDLLKVLETHGFALMSQYQFSPMEYLGSDKVTPGVQESWENSAFALPEYDVALSAALIYEGPSEWTRILNPKSVLSRFATPPYSVFTGYYDTGHYRITSLLAGMRFLETRMSELTQELRAKREQYSALFTRPTLYESKIGGNVMDLRKIRDQRNGTTGAAEQRSSLADRLKNYKR